MVEFDQSLCNLKFVLPMLPTEVFCDVPLVFAALLMLTIYPAFHQHVSLEPDAFVL